MLNQILDKLGTKPVLLFTALLVLPIVFIVISLKMLSAMQRQRIGKNLNRKAKKEQREQENRLRQLLAGSIFAAIAFLIAVIILIAI